MKQCNKCNEEKSLNDFYKYGGRISGACKDCTKRGVRKNRVLRFEQYSLYEKSRYDSRKEKLTANAKRWREKNPEAYRAQTAVGNAVRDGRLIKQPCFFCSSDKNIHAHHNDYSKPLDVIWLCAKCHHRAHAIFPEIRGHDKHA